MSDKPEGASVVVPLRPWVHLQAALLTAINCAVRTFLGGVTIVGAAGPLQVIVPPFKTLDQAVVGLGGTVADCVNPKVPTLVIGDTEERQLEPMAIRATFSNWC